MPKFAIVEAFLNYDHVTHIEWVGVYDNKESAEAAAASIRSNLIMAYRARAEYINEYIKSILIPPDVKSCLEFMESIGINKPFTQLSVSGFKDTLRYYCEETDLTIEGFNPPPRPRQFGELHVVKLPDDAAL
jgi:hypothetical protein